MDIDRAFWNCVTMANKQGYTFLSAIATTKIRYNHMTEVKIAPA
jgi:hypothetical protein